MTTLRNMMNGWMLIVSFVCETLPFSQELFDPGLQLANVLFCISFVILGFCNNVNQSNFTDATVQIKEITGNLPNITIHKAKMNKFDELITEFPADLEITIDISFLRKVVRRMTQNKKKRKESAERNTTLLPPPSKKVKREKMPEKKKESKAEENHSDIEDTNGNHKLLTLKAPSRGTAFEDKEFESKEFARLSK
jgi:hypothetical protein